MGIKRKCQNQPMIDRLCEELRKLGDTKYDIAVRLGCDYHSVEHWLEGVSLPSMSMLPCIHEAGADIVYILSGKRSRRADDDV